MDAFTDYYTVLGVSSDASAEAIKAAFKKLALQYHPDLYKGPDAEERMRELLAAYQTLNDREKRRQFDMQRSEHVYDASAAHLAAQGSVGHPAAHARPQGSSRVREEREQKFAFPTITEGSPITIKLLDGQYLLSAERAQTLLKLGVLRGTLAEPLQGLYHCHRCHHRWSSAERVGKGRPRACPKCQALDWDEYLLLRCQHCTAVFESEQIRYEIGSYTYGSGQREGATDQLCPPYELFPLCPQCRRSHWCPAEDLRVETLRAAAARRAAITRALWFLAAIAAILIIIMLSISLHV